LCRVRICLIDSNNILHFHRHYRLEANLMCFVVNERKEEKDKWIFDE